MKSIRKPVDGTRARLRRLRLWPLALAAIALIGCGRAVPPYWPDLTVAEDTLYVAQANGQVFALEASTGDVLWSYPTIERQGGGLLGGCSPSTPTDGPFYSAPVVGEELIFLGSAGQPQRSLWGAGENRSGLRVLNKMGILQWEFRGASDATVTSPALVQNTVYLSSSDRNVYAVDIESRSELWSFETGNWVWATPLVIEGQVFVASMDHVLYALDAQTGRVVWTLEAPRSALLAAPAYAEGVLYFGALDGEMFAARAETGELLWEEQLAGGIWATPLIQGEALFLGTLQGNVYALATTDGAELWTRSVGGQVRGTPAQIEGVVYFGCEDGNLYAFDAESGTPGISPLGRQLDGASIYTSPVTDGRYLYIVASDGNVFALDPESNSIVWQKNPLADDDREGS